MVMKDSGINYSSLVEEALMRQFWERMWSNNNTGWDIGHPSPPITEYMKQYVNKDAAILIPGCGNAYEAEFLIEEGFTNITLIDISPTAVERLRKKFDGVDAVKLICADFFAHNQPETYDLMIEQTFFCALNPDKRENYAGQAAKLLKPGGKIAGLLFGVEFAFDGPPFGGIRDEYENIFSKHFHIQRMDTAQNSIKPRQGNELFIEFVKK